MKSLHLGDAVYHLFWQIFCLHDPTDGRLQLGSVLRYLGGASGPSGMRREESFGRENGEVAA